MATNMKKSPPDSTQSGPAKRAQRLHGQVTRDLLIETAGVLFAEQGYADTTSKEICERAGVPLALVNYHFGGRDGFYEAVLIAAHHQLIALEDLVRMVKDITDPATKLRAVLRHLVGLSTRAEVPWGFRVLLREVMTPTGALTAVIDKAVRPKVLFLRALVGEVMGLPPEHPSVQRGMVFTILPCMYTMIMPKQVPVQLLPAMAKGNDRFEEELIRYVMAGLDALARAQLPHTKT
jgi:AcrR family transcriptional regulator